MYLVPSKYYIVKKAIKAVYLEKILSVEVEKVKDWKLNRVRNSIAVVTVLLKDINF